MAGSKKSPTFAHSVSALWQWPVGDHYESERLMWKHASKFIAAIRQERAMIRRIGRSASSAFRACSPRTIPRHQLETLDLILKRDSCFSQLFGCRGELG